MCHSKFICDNLTPRVMVLGGGPLGVVTLGGVPWEMGSAPSQNGLGAGACSLHPMGTGGGSTVKHPKASASEGVVFRELSRSRRGRHAQGLACSRVSGVRLFQRESRMVAFSVTREVPCPTRAPILPRFPCSVSAHRCRHLGTPCVAL